MSIGRVSRPACDGCDRCDGYASRFQNSFIHRYNTEESRMQQVYTVTRARPRNTISMVLLAVIDTAFNKHNARTLRSVCEDNIGKFAKSPAHASNVATAVRFPLGEIDGRSIGMHVYLSNNGDEPIHSHGQILIPSHSKECFKTKFLDLLRAPMALLSSTKSQGNFRIKFAECFLKEKQSFSYRTHIDGP